MLRIGLVALIILGLGHICCKSNAEIQTENAEKERLRNAAAKQKAYQNPLRQENVCPSFGNLTVPPGSPAVYDVSGDTFVAIAVPGFETQHYLAEYLTGALEIKTDAALKQFLSFYSRVCGKDRPPFFEKIPASKRFLARYQIAAGVNAAQLLDQSGLMGWRNHLKKDSSGLGKSPQLDDWRLAWLNARENPEIYNKFIWEGDEFAFQEKRSSLEALRRKTHILLSRVPLAEYDFGLGCFPLAEVVVSGDKRLGPLDFDSPLALVEQSPGYANDGIAYYQPAAVERLPKLTASLCIKMPPPDARFFKDIPEKDRDLVVLFRLRPEITQPYVCAKANDVVSCLREKRNERKVKIFVVDPIRYYATVGENTYKNF